MLVLGILASIAMTFLGVASIIRVRARENILFALFSLSSSLWFGANYVSNHKWANITLAQTFNQFTLAIALGVLFLLLCLVQDLLFREANKLAHKYRQILLIINFVAAGLALTTLTVKSVSWTGTAYAIKFGPLAYFYFSVVTVDLWTSIIDLFRGTRSKDQVVRDRAKLILKGFLVAVVFGVITNMILPLLGYFGLSSLGPLAIFAQIYVFGSLIIRQQLLNIKLAILRLTTYSASMLLVFGLYMSAVLFIIGQVFRRHLDLSYVLGLSGAFMAALMTGKLKKYFDKLSRKLFFQDSYETQEILDKIGAVIVGNINTHRIQRGAIEALSQALKPSYIAFLLLDTSGRIRINGLKGESWKSAGSAGLQKTLKSLHTGVVLTDDLLDGDEVKEVLIKEDISAVATLVTKEELLGYIVVGPKKSGNMYNQQDKGLLNIAANELAVALQNAQRFEEIEAFNITLQERVTEATRELKQTNKKLIALDDAKDEFISMASHQLRTPLTSIKGYLSMIIEGDLGKVSKQQEKALKEAFGSSQRMVFLIADFLNVSRIKTGKFVIEPKEVFLPEIVREELTQLREMAEAKDLTLKYEQPEVFPKVMLDDNKIRQVMMNMIDNAIYYTPSGGTITIQLYPTADEVIFKVIDTGIGVPKAEQHKLFAKFYRAGNARKARPDGTGLGLFMAQKIIIEQGGAVIFESIEGKGSTFGFRFPLSKIKAAE